MTEDMNKNKDMKDLWAKDEVCVREVKKWIYDNFHSMLWKKYLFWKNQLRLPAISKTIETGCGYGKFSMALGLFGEDVTLLDYNPDVIKVALKMHRSVNLSPKTIVGNLLEVSENNENKYDVVCSFGTLEHFCGEKRSLAFQACERLLKPGGLLFFFVPNKYAIFYRIAFGLRNLLGLVSKDFYEEPYSRKELETLALSSSIVPLEIECIGSFKWDFRHWILENWKSLIRKISKGKKILPKENFDINLQEMNLPKTVMNVHKTNYLDKNFSYYLFFAGKKNKS